MRDLLLVCLSAERLKRLQMVVFMSSGDLGGNFVYASYSRATTWHISTVQRRPHAKRSVVGLTELSAPWTCLIFWGFIYTKDSLAESRSFCVCLFLLVSIFVPNFTQTTWRLSVCTSVTLQSLLVVLPKSTMTHETLATYLSTCSASDSSFP